MLIRWNGQPFASTDVSDPVTKLAYQTLQQGKSILGLAHKEVSTRLMELVAPDASSSTVAVPPGHSIESSPDSPNRAPTFKKGPSPAPH